MASVDWAEERPGRAGPPARGEAELHCRFENSVEIRPSQAPWHRYRSASSTC
jgi:hypothetical protein